MRSGSYSAFADKFVECLLAAELLEHGVVLELAFLDQVRGLQSYEQGERKNMRVSKIEEI